MRRRLTAIGLALACLSFSVSWLEPASGLSGGSPAQEGALPSTALVWLPSAGGYCGGTLVTSTKVVTVAHCVTSESGVAHPAGDIFVSLGVVDFAQAADNAHNVVAVELHPDFAGGDIAYDVAVLTLAAPVHTPPTPVVKPSDRARWAAGTSATVAGWGQTSDSPDSSGTLQMGQVEIRDDADCGYGATLFCAGGSTVQACQGDSGGPLFVPGAGGADLLAGFVVAGDSACGGVGAADGYARLGEEPLNSWVHGQIDTTRPRVSAASPTGSAVSRAASMAVTFSEEIRRSTVTRSTFLLQRRTSTGWSGVSDVTVKVATDGRHATLNPYGGSDQRLRSDTKYRVVVSTQVRDVAGNRLDQDRTADGYQTKTWTFRTA